MRRPARALCHRRLAGLLCASLGWVAVVGVARGDFDPAGKKKRKPAVTAPAPGPGRAKKTGGTPGSGAPDGPRDPSAAKKDAVARAGAIAVARPGEAGPVLKLAQVYRERDGSLERGLAEWQTKSTDVALSADERWAAVVTYAGLLKSDRRDADAAKAYEAAAAEKPDHPTPIVALARLKQDGGDLKGASAQYERALALQKDKAEREATLRALMEIAVDLKDAPTAKKWHQELVRASGDSMAVRAELARLYFRKSQLEAAEAEYDAVVKSAAGDNRTLPGALLDLGLTQIKLQKYDDAIKTLRRGLAVAGGQAGARPRLLNAVAEAYRAENRLEELVGELEKENPGDVDRLELLGKLAAELDAERAIKWLTRALAAAPTHVDTRILLIRLLKEQSRMDEAARQYDLLIQHARGQPQFVFELCDLLIGRGDRPKALAKLKALEQSSANDADVQQRLAAYYSQIGEDTLALALMERLAAKSVDDPSYIVDLGDYYYQRNQTPKAKEIWKRLLVAVKPRPKALAALGEVYLDHDLGEDALEVFKQAIEATPGDTTFQKGLAAALERVRRYGEAQRIWEAILARNDIDKPTRREARTHLVLLWLAQKRLEAQVRPLSEAMRGPPPNLEAGRLLAEVLLHLRRLPDAERTLREIIGAAPGDVDARLVLERVLVQQGNIAAAIKVLDELVKADPKGARAYYTRLAQYALQLYRDEDAIRYAASAVELSPEDAEAHKKLGEMYRSQQDFGRAIRELRLSLQHNPKLWPVYFELAELLLAQAEEVEADALYRRVMRGAGDDELVANAIRLSAAINQKRGTLEVLENELLPMALSSSQKVVYRRLLVEVYANMTAPLIRKVRSGGRDAPAAGARLLKIGARGAQPLIDALGDADVTQQRTAIEILGFLENRSAGAPLFAYATGNADPVMRGRAMVACGALRDASLLPRYEAYLFPKAGPMPKDGVAVAAAFGVARIADARDRGGDRRNVARAGAMALRIVESTEALPNEMRIYGAIALGRTRDRAYVTPLEAYLKRADTGSHGRAAALYALAEIGDPAARPSIDAMVETSTDIVARPAAMLALARLEAAQRGGKAGSATDSATRTTPSNMALADAALDGNEQLRRGATTAMAVIALGEWRGVDDPLPVPEGTIRAEAAIAALVPTRYGAEELAATLVAFEKAITAATTTALQTSKERAVVALDAMLARAAGPSFAPFTDGADKETAAQRGALAAATRIADAAEPFVVGLVHHPDQSVQTRAVRWFGRRDTDLARDALVDALGDASVDVQRLAIEELSLRGNAKAVSAIGALLATHKEWSLRADAARALGSIGRRDRAAAVMGPLENAAARDPFAFVRETALRAIAASGRPGARELLEQAARRDAEPRVREVAAALAHGG